MDPEEGIAPRMESEGRETDDPTGTLQVVNTAMNMW